MERSELTDDTGGADYSVLPGAWVVTWTIIIALYLLVGCAPEAIALTPPMPTRSVLDARLRALSVDPAIQRAARQRLMLASREPEAPAIAIAEANETNGGVRAALASEVDETVIVAWLVSFGTMGAWTADNPRNAEVISIPVSEMSTLATNSFGGMRTLRLRDRQHLMLVRVVVDGDQAVGAVGFVLTQGDDDPTLEADATQLR